jgi:hypothetical protein
MKRNNSFFGLSSLENLCGVSSSIIIRIPKMILPALVFVVFAACGPVPSESSVDSVEIPQTPVENQQRMGFCWAYAAVGLVESDYKVRTGQELQLSEEALGFHRMVEGIYYLTQNLSGQDLVEYLNEDTFQGWVLSSDEVPDTFDLLKRYGVVPESVWTIKFEDPVQVEKMLRSIRRGISSLLLDVASPKSITREQIVEKGLLAPGAWPSAPPTTFQVDGVSFTPKTYLKEIGFEPGRFASVTTDRPEDLEKVIQATKRSLVRGVSVVLGFPVNFDRLEQDTFTGEGVDKNDPDNFFRDGGHAVLIDDFVNRGGQAGALPLDQVIREFLRPSTELDYFVFKNSWGMDAKKNEAGVVIEGSETGYYNIDREYLEGSANLSKLPEFVGMLEVVVPIDIARDPFGTESVNPVVALP